MSTVESVGATNSTFWSATSSAALPPMICSNLCALGSWVSEVNCSKTPTEDLLHTFQPGVILSALTPQGRSERFQAELHRRTVLPETRRHRLSAPASASFRHHAL